MRKKKNDKPVRRPYVLVTNDDGIVAPGIAALICALQPTCDLLVVAPDGPRSGAGCSITCTLPVSYRMVSEEPSMKAYACSGTPVDCVKMGLDVLCERRPDLLVSGVNLGNNASICTFYSGTIGAVTEGCIKGIPSIGFSLDTFDPAKANYALCTEYIVKIAGHVLKSGMPKGTMLNVNFPTTDTIKGMRVCRMAMGDWVKEYEPVNCPRGGNHYWMTGEYELHDKGNDHDMGALAEGYVSVVPQKLDMTDYGMMKMLRDLNTPAPAADTKRTPEPHAPAEEAKAEPATAAEPAAKDEKPKRKKRASRKKGKEANAATAETLAEVVEKSAEAVEKPAEVVETPAEVAEKPAKVVEKPAEVAETPAEAVVPKAPEDAPEKTAGTAGVKADEVAEKPKKARKPRGSKKQEKAEAAPKAEDTQQAVKAEEAPKADSAEVQEKAESAENAEMPDKPKKARRAARTKKTEEPGKEAKKTRKPKTEKPA